MSRVRLTVRRLTPKKSEAERIAAITSAQMESAITDLASECDISELLAIPGVWEAIADYFNNDAIARVLEESGEA